MPLPPALAARLAKRGIIKQQTQEGKGPEEEVFAESYDDDRDEPQYGRTGGRPRMDEPAEQKGNKEDKTQYMGYPGCPNKCNAYHDCTLWCQRTYAGGTPEADADPEYLRLHARMLERHPLPEGWKQHYDPGTGRHFYWCTRTDRVSWLPPGHPKARPTEAASRVREILAANRGDEELDDDGGQAMDLDSDMESGSESDADSEDDRRGAGRRRDDRRRRDEDDRRRDRDRRGGGRYRGAGDDGRPDPMDPSSYSDAPKGKWSAGLERAGKE